MMHNPKTKQTVYVKDRHVLSFKASKELLKELNDSGANDNSNARRNEK